MPVPKVVGISGPTRAGKTTLSYGIARKLCDIGSLVLLQVIFYFPYG